MPSASVVGLAYRWEAQGLTRMVAILRTADGSECEVPWDELPEETRQTIKEWRQEIASVCDGFEYNWAKFAALTQQMRVANELIDRATSGKPLPCNSHVAARALPAARHISADASFMRRALDSAMVVLYEFKVTTPHESIVRRYFEELFVKLQGSLDSVLQQSKELMPHLRDELAPKADAEDTL